MVSLHGDTFSYFLLVAILFSRAGCVSSATTISPDPCVSSTELSFLRQREVGYQLADGELPICDHYFTDGWYEMYDYVIASTEEGCGTHYNWYRTDELPDDNEIHQTTYCLNIGKGECGLTTQGLVKKCSEKKYVFMLLAVSGCSQAYCIEKLNGTEETDDTPPNISEITPVISPTVQLIDNLNELHFYCNFTPPVGTDYFYSVEWGITTGFSWTDLLLSTQPLRYGDHMEFMKSTALTEPILRQRGFARLGIRIACLTQAMNSPTGALSDSRVSDSKFCGIEVSEKKLLLDASTNVTITLELTVPFGCAHWAVQGCSLDVTMFIPDNSDRCRRPDLSQADQPDRVDNRCGVRFTNDDIMKPKKILVASILGHNVASEAWKYTLIFSTQTSFETHPLFQNYLPDTVEVDVSTDMTKINGKWCHSKNDPHMTTFDGLPYENQSPGTFLLYRNKEHNVQVQMKTTKCSYPYNANWCNCGVAVNAGRDVFIFDRCPGSDSQWRPHFRCRDSILARSVKKQHYGKKYIVFLPSGTEVRITLSTSLLNIAIKASLSDWGNTDGLCGLFNGNTADDRMKRPGSTQSDINQSWNLDKEDPEKILFNSTNDYYLTPWAIEKMLCHCLPKFGGNMPESYVECRPDKSKKCTDHGYETAYEDRCSVTRKKRNVHGFYVNKELDLYFKTDTKFVSKSSVRHEKIWKRTVYDYESAKADCLRVLNTSAFQMCSEVPVLKVDGFVEECVLDAVATNSMEWSLSHLESLKDQCLYEVKINQPLSAEDLAGTNSSADNTNSTEQLPPAFTQDFLESLEDVVCLNDCSGNGRCNNGDCLCDNEFIGEDCSIHNSEPPVMTGIPDNGECDLQLRACAKTSVFGMNFVPTTNLMCNLVPFKVGSDMKLTTEESFTSKANLETFVEVSCALSTERKKRSAVSDSPDYIAEGFKVSVSNDGIRFSEDDILVIFDSECVNCTINTGNIVCTKKPGYCVKAGQCYRYGERYGCYSCEGQDNILNWTPGLDCPMPIIPPTKSQKLWIIPAVVCPVVIMLIVVVLVCLYHWKRTRASKRKRIDTVHQEKPE